ncbi:Fusaric acid resistance protein family protein [compost metagenome]
MMVGFSAISASFFGSSDNASPKLKKALLITIVCPLIAGLYMFGLHPLLRHPETVMLSLGILLLPVGLFISFNPAGVLVAFMIIANLSWQNFSSANNFNAYLEAASAISLGFLTTLLVTLVFNLVSTRYFLRRLILACRQDFRLAKNGNSNLSKEEFLSVMLHRMTLIGTRVPKQKRQSSTEAILRNIHLGLSRLPERKT